MMLWIIGLIQMAVADQCAWNDAAVAEKAKSVLKVGMEMREWCEPCGESTPGPVTTIQSIVWQSPEKGYFEVVINGEAKDLAYLFVNTGKGFVNAGIAAGCEPVSVSERIPSNESTSVQTHCSSTEHVVFSCLTASKNKTVSICAEQSNKSSLQYRFGVIGKPEFTFPEKRGSTQPFRYEEQQYIRAEETAIRFRNKGVQYAVVSRVGGTGGSVAEAEYNNFVGVEVTLTDGKVVSIPCSRASEIQDAMSEMQGLLHRP